MRLDKYKVIDLETNEQIHEVKGWGDAIAWAIGYYGCSGWDLDKKCLIQSVVSGATV